MLPRYSSDPQIVLGNSGANSFQIGLDVAVVLRGDLVGRQDRADAQKLLKLFQGFGLMFGLESAAVKLAKNSQWNVKCCGLKPFGQAGSRRKWATMMEVSSRTLSVVLIQLLAAFGDNPLQFVGFLARQRACGAVGNGVAFLIRNQLEPVDIVRGPLQIRGREGSQILNNGVKLRHDTPQGLGANGGGRTHMAVNRWNLNPVRLPVPPHSQPALRITQRALA